MPTVIVTTLSITATLIRHLILARMDTHISISTSISPTIIIPMLILTITRTLLPTLMCTTHMHMCAHTGTGTGTVMASTHPHTNTRMGTHSHTATRTLGIHASLPRQPQVCSTIASCSFLPLLLPLLCVCRRQ